MSKQTVRNRLHSMGLKSRRARRKPLLTDEHKRNRLRWARAHRRWRLRDWRRCMFTDEVRITLHSGDSRIRVWRRDDESRHADVLINRREAYGGGGRMFWGGISL